MDLLTFTVAFHEREKGAAEQSSRPQERRLSITALAIRDPWVRTPDMVQTKAEVPSHTPAATYRLTNISANRQVRWLT